MTALHFAVQKGHTEVVKLLANAGALPVAGPRLSPAGASLCPVFSCSLAVRISGVDSLAGGSTMSAPAKRVAPARCQLHLQPHAALPFP